MTECVGGPANLTESDLHRDYRSSVDPRLNYEQAMEMAFLLAEEMKQRTDRPAATHRRILPDHSRTMASTVSGT